jgi:prepilin-type N-terminal cleavage/methylation domain-containing protein
MISPRSAPRAPRLQSGFTMVEIAICLAIIGIALVAIIGVLPYGMRAQRDNRERTVINQDATVFLDAIRNGARGADDLTNYVYAIVNTWAGVGYTNALAGVMGFQTANLLPAGSDWRLFLTNGANIVGLLSTPEYTGGGVSNHIVAYVRALSGSAVNKPPQDNPILQHDSFGYHLVCANVPVQLQTNGPSAYAGNLQANLHELRLTFLWPQLPNGNLPQKPWKQNCRTLIAGQLAWETNVVAGQTLYFFQPQSFAAPATTNAP